jgi:hypothetical protein
MLLLSGIKASPKYFTSLGENNDQDYDSKTNNTARCGAQTEFRSTNCLPSFALKLPSFLLWLVRGTVNGQAMAS